MLGYSGQAGTALLERFLISTEFGFLPSFSEQFDQSAKDSVMSLVEDPKRFTHTVQWPVKSDRIVPNAGHVCTIYLFSDQVRNISQIRLRLLVSNDSFSYGILSVLRDVFKYNLTADVAVDFASPDRQEGALATHFL